MGDDTFKVVADFFGRFYHQEPDDDLAVIQAHRKSRGHIDYRWHIAQAFREILSADLPPDYLRDFVSEHANRFCRTRR